MHCKNGHDTINSIGNCYTCGEPILPLAGMAEPKKLIVLCPNGHDTINSIGNCYTCGEPAIKEEIS